MMTATTPLTRNSTYNYPSTPPSTNPSSEEKLTLLVAGIAAPLLVIALVALVIVTIIIFGQKSEKPLKMCTTMTQNLKSKMDHIMQQLRDKNIRIPL